MELKNLLTSRLKTNTSLFVQYSGTIDLQVLTGWRWQWR